MIEVKNISKSYGKRANTFDALKDISFTIQDGESVAILGKSGSGKSTLMHAISGLDRPQNGEVLINGVDILKLKRKPLDTFRARTIGFVFQSFFVQGNETCSDNVSLPLEIANVHRRERRDRIKRALESVELGDKLSTKAKNLSGGQKQRLAIARAIAGAPKILFADEPTGNLDSTTSDRVENLLFDFSRDNKATLIIVTHDEDLANKCHRIIRIKDGAIESISAPTIRRPQPVARIVR